MVEKNLDGSLFAVIVVGVVGDEADETTWVRNLIEDVPYNIDPDKIRLSAGALEAVQMLAAADYQIFIITNQSGIARGYLPESALIDVEKHLRQLLATAGVSLASFYYCPHHPQGVITEFAIDCDCRKPNPG